jgi:hypothetical protein
MPLYKVGPPFNEHHRSMLSGEARLRRLLASCSNNPVRGKSCAERRCCAAFTLQRATRDLFFTGLRTPHGPRFQPYSARSHGIGGTGDTGVGIFPRCAHYSIIDCQYILTGYRELIVWTWAMLCR